MATWACPGCTKPYSEDDPKAIVRHISECDYTDGAGQPIDLNVKFSVVHWYIAAVRSDKLAGVAGGLPFADLRGRVEDGFEDEATEEAVAEFLNSLAEAAGPAEADGFEISDVYDARLDRPCPSPGQPSGDDTTREQARSHAREQAALILDTDLTHEELAAAAWHLASAFRDIDTGTVR